MGHREIGTSTGGARSEEGARRRDSGKVEFNDSCFALLCHDLLCSTA
jgi:hypothetical protein